MFVTILFEIVENIVDISGSAFDLICILLCLSVCLSVRLSVRLPVCLSVSNITGKQMNGFSSFRARPEMIPGPKALDINLLRPSDVYMRW